MSLLWKHFSLLMKNVYIFILLDLVCVVLTNLDSSDDSLITLI